MIFHTFDSLTTANASATLIVRPELIEIAAGAAGVYDESDDWVTDFAVDLDLEVVIGLVSCAPWLLNFSAALAAASAWIWALVLLIFFITGAGF